MAECMERKMRSLFIQTSGDSGIPGPVQAAGQQDEARRQVKSRDRVRERGEVFTADREVKAMCDLVKNETERIDSTFLEPACGDGNFLVEILRRKLETVRKSYSKSANDFAFYSIRALMSLYGVDIMADNVEACRERLLEVWLGQGDGGEPPNPPQWDGASGGPEPHPMTGGRLQGLLRVARFVLEKNILLGNTLSMKMVDSKGDDTPQPIVFTEWTFPLADKPIVKRREFRLDTLQRDEGDTLFAWAEKENDAFIPVPIGEYPAVDYRELCASNERGYDGK